AGGPRRVDEVHDSVTVAVGPHLDDLHRVSTRLALAPERTTGATPKRRLPSFDGSAQRFLVRVRHHPPLPRASVLDDHRHEPCRIPLERREIHAWGLCDEIVAIKLALP